MNSKLKAPTVITSHTNADFDALASMVAASKLYPNSVLVFPGTQEKNIKHFFIKSAIYLFNFRSFKDIDPDSVQQLIVVDTRQQSRLPHIAPLLERKNLIIHTYDHHPASNEDLKAQTEIFEPWGSTTSILVERIKEKQISLTPEEATILGLGLYEDTGCFTFISTTDHDLTAAAWLLSQGMDLNLVADMLSRDLNAEQVSVLNSLLEAATTHNINGVEVVIAEVTTEHYLSDFALLAHKLVDMENIRVLFALGRMQDRVHIVARSRTPEVNVGQICKSFGGGGHAFAASATVKDKTLHQVKDELFGLLYSHINPQILVKDLMSKPAVTTPKTQTIAKVAEVMTRYGLKAMPVVDESGLCVGIIEHQLAEKAIGHGLGEMETREYMLRDFTTATPESDLYQVMEIILGQRQRLLPIMENNAVIGVVTRTDLINFIVQEPARIPESLLPERKRERNIHSLLKDRLPERHFNFLVQAGELGQNLGMEIYAVGGFVRDILLHRENSDIDLVIEGDGLKFAQALGNTLKGRVRSHDKFKTAVIILDNGQRIDVATARLEYYEYPAALPTVELSSIKMDLFRRDFTINALAVHLNPPSMGQLVDFFGGQKDIKDRAIRVLHSLSFVEDPTRILRAIRFEKRFHFQLGAHTERLIKNALGLNLIHKLSGSRLFHELKLIMEEEAPLSCFQRMEKFNILQAMHPLLKLDPTKESILSEVEKVLNWYRLLYIPPEPKRWMVHFLGLCSGLNVAQTKILLRRLHFSKKIEEQFLEMRSQIQDAVGHLFEWNQLSPKLSDLFFILSPLPLEGILYLMARSQKEEIRRHISIYLTQLKNQRIAISGRDIQGLGLASGPAYSGILKEVLAAKLDGLACDRSAQLDLAQKIIHRLS